MCGSLRNQKSFVVDTLLDRSEDKEEANCDRLMDYGHSAAFAAAAAKRPLQCGPKGMQFLIKIKMMADWPPNIKRGIIRTTMDGSSTAEVRPELGCLNSGQNFARK